METIYIMRNRFFTLLASLILVIALCGCAAQPTASGLPSGNVTQAQEETKAQQKKTAGEEATVDTGRDVEEITLDSIPSVGDRNNGFTVTKVYPCDDWDATIVEFEHDGTEAPLVWIANESTDRGFMVTFRTHVNDDRGIPHVFEHASLSGNEKYPNPNMMLSMVSGTYNTFLNALTSTTCTCFPSSSLSEDQLLKFVDYYMNGVYRPLVLTDERSMMREAYRYELTDPNADITLQGTVYSEMQGSRDQRSVAREKCVKMAFPGSYVSSVTGGVPGEIEKITQQDLRDFHDKYYHPSNSLMVLTGDLHLERFLEFLDQRFLSRYEKQETDLSDAGYKPLRGDVEAVIEYPVSAGEQAETVMCYMIPLDGVTMEEQELMSAAVSAMDQKNQTFDQKIHEMIPGVNVDISFFSREGKNALSAVAVGAKEEDKDAVVSAIRAGIRAVLEEGINKDALQSVVNEVRYGQAMSLENKTVTDLAMEVTQGWVMFGETDSFIKLIDVDHDFKRYLAEGEFDRLLRKYLSRTESSALVVCSGVPGLKEANEQKQRQKLDAMKAAMSDEEIEALVKRTQDFNQWLENNQKSLSLDSMTAVTVQDLPEEGKRFIASDEDADGMRVVSSEVDSDLTKVRMYFDASGLPNELVDTAAFYYGFLSLCPTTKHDEKGISSMLNRNMIGFDAGMSTLKKDDGSYRPYLVLGFSCFPDQIDDAFDTVGEVLLEGDLSDAGIFRTLGQTYAKTVRNNTDPNGLAQLVGKAALNEASAYDLHCSGAAAGITAEKIGQMMDEELKKLGEDIRAVRDTVMNRSGMMITVAGNADNIKAVRDRASGLYGQLDDTVHPDVDRSDFLKCGGKNIAVGFDSPVMYNYEIMPTKALDTEYSTKLAACGNAVESLVVVPALRYENSVYSAGVSVGRDWMAIMAYRDPRLKETFTEVMPSFGERVRALKLTQKDVDPYIVSVYSSLAAPIGPFSGASTAINDILEGKDSFERLAAGKRDLKETVPADVTAFADVLDKINETGAKATVGSSKLIGRDSSMFDVIDMRLVK